MVYGSVPPAISASNSNVAGAVPSVSFESISAVRTSLGAPFSSTTGATSACIAATMACSTSAPANNSNESNTCPTAGGNGVGAKLPDATVVVGTAAVAVVVVELPS